MQKSVTVAPNEAKAWAKENFKGIVTATIPTYTQDMKYLNEKAIAHERGRPGAPSGDVCKPGPA